MCCVNAMFWLSTCLSDSAIATSLSWTVDHAALVLIYPVLEGIFIIHQLIPSVLFKPKYLRAWLFPTVHFTVRRIIWFLLMDWWCCRDCYCSMAEVVKSAWAELIKGKLCQLYTSKSVYRSPGVLLFTRTSRWTVCGRVALWVMQVPDFSSWKKSVNYHPKAPRSDTKTGFKAFRWNQTNIPDMLHC